MGTSNVIFIVGLVVIALIVMAGLLMAKQKREDEVWKTNRNK